MNAKESISRYLAILVCVVSLVTMAGYAVKVHPLLKAQIGDIEMAFSTALCLFLLSLGMMLNK